MIENNVTAIDMTISSGVPTTEILVVVSILLLVGTIIYRTKNRNKNTQNIEENNRLINLKKNIREKIEKVEIEFYQKAINYYLPTLLLDTSLSREERKAFLKECNHVKVISLERIDWSDFSITGEEGNILDDILEEKTKNFSEKNDFTIKDAFKFMLLEKAEKEAQKIINEKEKNVQFTK